MVKECACNAGETGLIPESGRSPGEGNGYSLQYSCLENYMNRGVWQAIVLGVTKSQTQLNHLPFITFTASKGFLFGLPSPNSKYIKLFWVKGITPFYG